MDQSAFNALFKKSTTPKLPRDAMPKSSKRQRTPENNSRWQHGGASGSRFADCPICGKSVHVSLANGHVERCVVESSKKTIVAPSSPLLVEGQPPATLRQQTESSTRPCIGPQQHEGDGGKADELHDGVQPAVSTQDVPSSAAGFVSQVANLERKRKLTHAIGNSEQQGIRASGIDGGTTSNNAFSRLMTASALANFREEMYLWRHDDGTFSWGWGPAGSPRPAPPSADSSLNRLV